MFFYQPEEEFRTLPDGSDLHICRYDRANRWFFIGKRRYFGCDDLTVWHCKSYPIYQRDCSADLFINRHLGYVLRIYCKIPEFDEFDSGDHSFIYYILTGVQLADRLFDAVDGKLFSLEYEENSKPHTLCVIRRGLSDLSLDAFTVYETV